MSDGYSIFVSYAHVDETFKNELHQHIAVLEHNKVVTAWDDRCIDGGDDWREKIFSAIDSCHLALMLVSPAFLDSDFIYTEELNRLLQRRQRDGIRVVPIIVRPCGWKYEACLESLQVLPQDGKAIGSFPLENCVRDQVWGDIVDAIAAWAKLPLPAPPPALAETTQTTATWIASLGQQLAAGDCPDLAPASRQLLLAHSPANPDQYRIARWAEWSQPRYAVDKRFTRLALLVDQGPQAQGQRWQEQQREFQDLREVLNEVDDPALVLLGPPGCGKSTLLRRLELDLAVDALRSPQQALISLFLPLSRYRPAREGAALPSPRDWIAQEWQRPLHHQLPSFADLLRTGRLVLLLDAINEMPHAGIDDYRLRIESWSAFIAEIGRDAPGTRIIFSCRSLDYSASLSSPQQSVPHVRIKELSDLQVQDFLGRYSPEHGTELWHQLKGTPQLDIFRSPFYLRLLVQQSGADATLRGGRAALFTAFARGALAREIEARNPLFSPGVLLVRRDYERALRGDWAGAFELAANSPLFAALAQLALRMQERCAAGGEARIRVKYAEALTLLDRFDAEALLEAGAALQVLDIARDEVLFLHQLVQEYFAGRALAAAPQPARARVAWRADEMSPSLDEVLAGLADSDPLPAAPGTGWEESFLLAAAMASDPDAFVQALISINLPLAGRAAAQPDVVLAEPLRQRLRDLLVQRSRDPEADLRARIAAARALGELGDPRFDKRQGRHGDYLLPPLVTIPAGDYMVGSDEGIEADEAPARRVPVAAFAIARFPLTNAEWKCFMDAGGYDDERWWQGEAAARWQRGEAVADGAKQQYREFRQSVRSDPGQIDRLLAEKRITSEQARSWREWYIDLGDEAFEELLDRSFPSGTQRQPRFWTDPSFNHPAQPVVGVCWHEARAYCAWLSAQTGQNWQLPSEAQWQAAAAGSAARRFAWGKEFDVTRCNAFESHVRGTTPVGVFAAGDTPEGVSDLTGNVWEWTGSAYRPYPYIATDGREDFEDGEVLRVARGGSWFDLRHGARCAYRRVNPPGFRDLNLGFRVLCVSPIP